MLSLNGDINTGITIRTVHLKDGIATYPAGATLLYDSDPAAEEAETRIKATGFFRALEGRGKKAVEEKPAPVGEGIKMLLVDNDDCFIQTLANYARQTGAEVVTYRSGIPEAMIDEINPDLILVSPGPGRTETGPVRRPRRVPGVWRLPGPAGHRGGLRWRVGCVGLPHARQAVQGPPFQ
jgi:anthranilate synthase